MGAETIAIEVACAERDGQTLIALVMPAGSTAGDALARSGIFERHPGIERSGCSVGIFGREVAQDYVLADGDRVEVLRPLPEDPRDRRRRLARQGAAMGKRSA